MKPLGIQLHSLREDFKEDPARTLYAIREMGYSGVEMPIGSVTALNEGLGEKGAAYYRRLFAEADLACYGLLTSWELVLPENLERTMVRGPCMECFVAERGMCIYGCDVG